MDSQSYQKANTLVWIIGSHGKRQNLKTVADQIKITTAFPLNSLQPPEAIEHHYNTLMQLPGIPYQNNFWR
ncbi:hypothetical protein KSU1_B0454 [Candidatus Jettenia caeni]|uniref:Uncharacterized protein n=1 Tax=Candidatus Jettenia caeni TaxID=247490 RepID=I3IHW6_9BACT|nr:MAG: hypothetical protein EDM77_12655 [Candidatus Jettenia sp. AMX1]MCE7881637.1 hypothetical protein [Candidatus Jettenia sp. AMX1]GAB61311.1 hypothetical protein KSU1_B0454 [Candidatus Jettenia caeni]